MAPNTVSATFFYMPDFRATDRTAPTSGWLRAGVTSTQTRGLKWVAPKKS
jgi:hypothetical protein